MKKTISFSLWGNNPIYTHGAVANTTLAKEFFPDWVCRYYVDDSVNEQTITDLKNADNTEIVMMKTHSGWNGLFWRFLAASEGQIMISRDTDSRLGERDRASVNTWLDSGKAFHIIRDHPWHTTPILGGLFGVRGDCLADIEHLISNFTEKTSYQNDQTFLRDVVYPRVRRQACVHDEFFDGWPCPSPRSRSEFMGQSFSEHDEPDQEHITALANWLDHPPPYLRVKQYIKRLLNISSFRD